MNNSYFIWPILNIIENMNMTFEYHQINMARVANQKIVEVLLKSQVNLLGLLYDTISY